MALEDLTGDVYIDSLVATNPVGSTDKVKTLDDHVRGIKNVLLKSFPSITGAVTATNAELSKLAGVTATTAELNKLAGLSATTTELNKLYGVTATTAEINKLAGLLATTAELNKLAGSTFSATELNYITGVTSAIQTQLDARALASRTLTAGDGLTGGGDLTANRTFTLGTPGSVTSSSTNGVTATSHTHELAAGAVVEAKLGTGAVTVTKLGNQAVTTIKLATNERMTTDNVLGATAGAAAGAVGTYVFAYGGASDIAFGGTVAGSSLQPTGAAYTVNTTGSPSNYSFTLGSALAGTWRCMGYYDRIPTQSSLTALGATLWLRIS
jgi:hypothetical protein